MDRIRWQPADEGNLSGFVGSITEPLFTLWAPQFEAEKYALSSNLPGQGGSVTDDLVADGTAPLMAEAEKLLQQFAASLGAAFPEGAVR